MRFIVKSNLFGIRGLSWGLVLMLGASAGCARSNPAFSDEGGTGSGSDTYVDESSSSTTQSEPDSVCGNGVVEGMEVCDAGPAGPEVGCVECQIPRSCLHIHTLDDALPSGQYDIKPDGSEAYVAAYCDMETDGGGYTFLKIDGERLKAQGAEDRCAEFGMQLWIPRSPAHLQAGVDVALDPEIPPNADHLYLEIMGVRPKELLGSTCGNQALNSDNEECGWEASDGENFFVTEAPMGPEPNGDPISTTVVSMQYYWSPEGDLTDLNDWAGEGHGAPRFMCDVGDKY
ncbi:MAG: fibrinogen-like YCDxxxxGGGW domain-containing protein [Myxococcota bacterium]